MTTGKLAMGENHESINVNGVSSFSFPIAAPTAITPGGLFAQRSYIGRQTQDQWAWIPEVQVQVGMDITRNIRAFVGYEGFYISKVVRPGDQIDHTRNFTQNATLAGPPGTLVGAPRPTPVFNTTDFWVQGLNLGVEFRF